MPITSELHNTRRLRDAGFSQEQAEILAELLEDSQQQGFEKFAEVLTLELGKVRHELNGEIKDLRAEMHASMKDLAVKLMTLVVAVVTVAVAVIKLFPDLY